MSRPRRVLSFDGGGIRGVSSLIILQRIMEEIRDKNELPEVPRPCDYFDLIGGTSTGGLIAIMLGRLGMSVKDCIAAYKEMAEKAFVPKRYIYLPAPPNGVYSATALKQAIIEVVKTQCKEGACKEGGCSHGEMDFRKEGCTRTVVLAITKDDLDASPTLFKTYDRSDELTGCKIWEVARATSAATTFFKSIKCGQNDIEYIDAGFGYNNPCEILLAEARTVFGLSANSRTFVLSIGTGLGGPVSVINSRLAIIKALKKMATSSARAAESMDRQLSHDMYYRFNVSKGLSEVSLADWTKKSKIASHTSNYLRDQSQVRRIEKCADNLRIPTVQPAEESGRIGDQEAENGAAEADRAELAGNGNEPGEFEGARAAQ
ncbi:hypothetical protein H2201_008664 [Coniosporium apollinis]|uniref:PNPLA domain-containing protein n=1 Tax=Coniosporium apollinis TaxID=61459 RepID=A0ABQ9NG19_9PEZI|nr:hypothetical protein H2201_008664 [Coniosporium apollinis]